MPFRVLSAGTAFRPWRARRNASNCPEDQLSTAGPETDVMPVDVSITMCRYIMHKIHHVAATKVNRTYIYSIDRSINRAVCEPGREWVRKDETQLTTAG